MIFREPAKHYVSKEPKAFNIILGLLRYNIFGFCLLEIKLEIQSYTIMQQAYIPPIHY